MVILFVVLKINSFRFCQAYSLTFKTIAILRHCRVFISNDSAVMHLAAALRGDVNRGLFFRGSEPVPFGAEIRPVRDLVSYLLATGTAPRA